MKKILVLIVVVVLAVGVFVSMKNKGMIVRGVGDSASSYKNITSANASTTDPTEVRGGPGILDNIVVASSSAVAIKVYDGAANATSSGGTLIATIKASVAEQTFPFGIAVTKGIVVDAPAGFNGSYTVTSR